MPTELNLFLENIEIAERDAENIPIAQAPEEIHLIVKQIIESLLFSSAEPLSSSLLRDLVALNYPLSITEIEKALTELAQDYARTQRAFFLEKLPEGYLLRTAETFSPYLQRLHFGRRGEKLSRASQEVLAIVAYRQPISRPAVEALRGVDSSAILSSLADRELIESSGRPTLYRTTLKFLKHFGLRSIKDLPKLEKA